MGAPSRKVMLVDPSGSSPIVTHNLANTLVQRGWGVDLYSGPRWTRAMQRYENAGYEVVEHFYVRGQSASHATSGGLGRQFWRLFKTGEHVTAMRRLLDRAPSYEVAHFQWFVVPLLDVFWLRRLISRVPVVYTVHNLRPHDHYHSPVNRAMFPVGAYRRLYHLASALIAHSDVTVQGLVQEFGVPREKVHKIPHGAADHLLRDGGRGGRGPAPRTAHDERTVLFFGEIRHNKGLDVLLRAAARIAREGGRFKLVVAGRPEIGERRILSQIRDLGIDHLVDLHLGHVAEEHVADFFERAHVVVLPYRLIDQSGVAVVACSFGKAIVATRCGGVQELVQEAGNGLLVAIDDDEALALAIRRVLDDDALRGDLETRSRAYARSVLSWDRVCTATTDVYERVIAERQP